MRTKFQSWGHGPYLLGRRQPGCGGRGPGALGGRTWPRGAKRFSPSPSRGRVSRRLPARPAAARVREPRGRRQLLFPPRSPRAPRPQRAWLQRPRRERRRRLRMSGAARLLSRWLPLASVARVRPRGVGQGTGSPVGCSSRPSRRRPLPGWGSGQGRRPQGRGRLLKFSESLRSWRRLAGLRAALASPVVAASLLPETLTWGFNFVVAAPGTL